MAPKKHLSLKLLQKTNPWCVLLFLLHHNELISRIADTFAMVSLAIFHRFDVFTSISDVIFTEFADYCRNYFHNRPVLFSRFLIPWTTKMIHKNTESMRSRKNNRLDVIVLNTFFIFSGILCAVTSL